MEKAARILQLHQDEGIPYNPAEDGFVFSNDEIETSRLREANNAYYASA